MISDYIPRDAGAMAWAVVATCLIAAALAYVLQKTACGRERAFWLTVLVVMLGLGLNKQLDLQTDMTRIFKTIAQAQGWYEQRRAAQAVFISGLGMIVLASSIWLIWLARGTSVGVRVAMIGMIMLAGFVMLRAASMHQVDIAVRLMVAGTKLYNLVELGGALLVVLGAVLARRQAAGAKIL